MIVGSNRDNTRVDRRPATVCVDAREHERTRTGFIEVADTSVVRISNRPGEVQRLASNDFDGSIGVAKT